jgi:hypothetical protein
VRSSLSLKEKQDYVLGSGALQPELHEDARFWCVLVDPSDMGLLVGGKKMHRLPRSGAQFKPTQTIGALVFKAFTAGWAVKLFLIVNQVYSSSPCDVRVIDPELDIPLPLAFPLSGFIYWRANRKYASPSVPKISPTKQQDTKRA